MWDPERIANTMWDISYVDNRVTQDDVERFELLKSERHSGRRQAWRSMSLYQHKMYWLRAQQRGIHYIADAPFDGRDPGFFTCTCGLRVRRRELPEDSPFRLPTDFVDRFEPITKGTLTHIKGHVMLPSFDRPVIAMLIGVGSCNPEDYHVCQGCGTYVPSRSPEENQTFLDFHNLTCMDAHPFG